jgi:hypothetical protein
MRRRAFIAGLGRVAARGAYAISGIAANRSPKNVKSEIKGVTLAIKKEKLP